MKNTTMKTLRLFVVGFLLTHTACKKCYVCEGTYVCVRCYKGTDTVGDCNWAGSSVLAELLSQRKLAGYLCDTTSSYKSSIDLCKDNYPVTKEQLETNGLSCDKKSDEISKTITSYDAYLINYNNSLTVCVYISL